MKAKFQIGEMVKTNARYRSEGQKYFGKNLRHRNFKGRITEVFENTDDEKDGHGDIWENFYKFENGAQICELFLEPAV